MGSNTSPSHWAGEQVPPTQTSSPSQVSPSLQLQPSLPGTQPSLELPSAVSPVLVPSPGGGSVVVPSPDWLAPPVVPVEASPSSAVEPESPSEAAVLDSLEVSPPEQARAQGPRTSATKDQARCIPTGTIARFAAVAAGSTIGPSGVLFFLGTYAATNLGAFIAVHAVSERLGSENISDFAGLPKRSPLLAAVLSLCLLSLTGIPPTAGFIAKVYVFNGAIQTGHDWLVILVAVAVLNTAISAFYYLRWLRTMWIDEPEDDSRFEPAPAVRGVLVAAAIGVLFFGLWPAPLIEAARSAAETLL